MKPETKTMLSTVIFFGALWGLAEATLGYALQFLPPIVSGAVMMPIGALILIRGFTSTDSTRAVFLIALVAISVKAVNFFLPGLPPIKTYNPMIAMLLQTVFIAGVLPVLKRENLPVTIVSFIGASIAWRLAFLLNNSLNHALTGFEFNQLATPGAMLDFALFFGVLNGVVLGVVYVATRPLKVPLRLSGAQCAAFGAAMFALAGLLTCFL